MRKLLYLIASFVLVLVCLAAGGGTLYFAYLMVFSFFVSNAPHGPEDINGLFGLFFVGSFVAVIILGSISAASGMCAAHLWKKFQTVQN